MRLLKTTYNVGAERKRAPIRGWSSGPQYITSLGHVQAVPGSSLLGCSLLAVSTASVSANTTLDLLRLISSFACGHCSTTFFATISPCIDFSST
jgi:hypothetical protein